MSRVVLTRPRPKFPAAPVPPSLSQQWEDEANAPKSRCQHPPASMGCIQPRGRGLPQLRPCISTGKRKGHMSGCWSPKDITSVSAESHYQPTLIEPGSGRRILHPAGTGALLGAAYGQTSRQALSFIIVRADQGKDPSPHHGSPTQPKVPTRKASMLILGWDKSQAMPASELPHSRLAPGKLTTGHPGL